MKRFSNRLLRGLAAGVALAALSFAPLPATAQVEKLEIIAPAAPGGGWDQTARAMQACLEEEGLASGIQVVNIPGAGGTIGLAQFVSSKEGKGDTIMVMGFIMTGAILTNKSPVNLDNVKPIARLIGEYEAIVVPTDSDIQSMGDLVEKIKADTASVSWGGGSAGGTDHILVGLLTKDAGADTSKINYIAHSGGGEAMSAIMGGHVTAGVNGLAEVRAQIDAGKLRGLAISSEERLEGLDMPTLKEQGVNVALTNWRGVVAPPGISDEDHQKLADMIDKMAKGQCWQNKVKENGWIDLYQPAAEFTAFLAEDTPKVESTLKDIGLVQ